VLLRVQKDCEYGMRRKRGVRGEGLLLDGSAGRIELGEIVSGVFA
jgi:hypothetical protein